jgi:uncharacterized protein with HEPN domain
MFSLIHDYLGVDYELVWGIVMSKIPDLRRAMEEIRNNDETV